MDIEVDVDGGILTAVLNRPDKLNALSYGLIAELQEVLDAAEQDVHVRALILTGAGDRAFSAGADIDDLARSVDGGPEVALREVIGIGHGLTRRIENFTKPIIVAVNGMALGGGCEVTEAAHLAIAADHATFGKPEIGLGFPPPFGGSQRFARHAGRKRALELILTGDPISAERAYGIGLVNRVVPSADLMDEARRLALRIVRWDAGAVSACLSAVTRGINLPIDEGLGVEAAWFAHSVATGSAHRGLSRFLNRRS